MRHVVAVDQSTSGTKAVLFDETGRALAHAARPHRQIYPRPGWVEHDAEEIYRNVLAVLGELSAAAPAAVRGAACLSLTNQRETFVVFDRATGRPLHDAVVWQCRRGDPVCHRIAAAGHAEAVKERTGLALDSYFPAPKIRRLLEDEELLRDAVRSGRAAIGTIDAYLVHRLTAGRVFATDHTNASRTLLFDIERLRWDEELCALFDCPSAALPEVRASAESFGTTDAEGALPSALPIRGVMGDSQAALFAQRAFAPGSAKVTLGTGSSVLLNVGDTARRSSRGIVTTVAWVHEGRPAYAFEGIINCTGATVAWLKDQLGILQSPEETERLATSVEGNGGVYLVPAFVGLGAPYWREDARAAIVGLSPHSTRAHVARAALEAIAYQIRDVLDAMAVEAGRPLVELSADGGMVANGFLMQLIADVARVDVRASTVPELSALGGALAGMLGTGLLGSLADVERLDLGVRRYTAALPPARVDELLDGWRRAVGQTLHRGER
ncbi:MAG: glycerol kinase GlpK [Vicinamibacteria bacterium]